MSITEEDVEINVTMKPRGFEETKDAIKGTGDEAGRATNSYRALGRDFMMIGRAVNVLNREFLGNNIVLKEMTGILFSLTAVLRLAAAAQHLLALASVRSAAAETASAVATAGATAVHALQIAVLWAKAQALAVVNALSGPAGWVALGAAAIVGATYLAQKNSAMKSMQAGGIVTQTGPHFLHAGEVVTNPRTTGQASAPSYSQINIDMKTGAISSDLDIESMLVDMSGRIISASKSRTGHG